MPSELKILGVHGLGDHRQSPWATDWAEVLRESFSARIGCTIDFKPVAYDDIFAKIKISAWQSIKAFAKLAGSGIGQLFRRKARGMTAGSDGWLKWYAGYVVAWVENEKFRTQARQLLLQKLLDEKPDVVVAHSLGSLISYDAFSSAALEGNAALDAQIRKLTLVTLGSQIGNAFVVGNLMTGRIEMPPVNQWFHLYNPEDDVFTAEVRLPGVENFVQVMTQFDDDGWADHNAVSYLQHRATQTQVWMPIAQEAIGVPRGLARATGLSTPHVVSRPPLRRGERGRKRALLVGINDYPDPEDRLEGCVNDVFLMSSVLQECKFPADGIRVVLNDRATAKGILERLRWLLDDPQPDDQLVFYYSGHGAQLPTYGEGDAVDHTDETLVPCDFDWSPATCVTDDVIYGMYSQLPYRTRLAMIFDCCHSGGIHRGGAMKVRGLEPPDDIRHRALRWDQDKGMWVARGLTEFNRAFTTSKRDKVRFAGTSGTSLRLGRAMMLRQTSMTRYRAAKRRTPIVGPYLPLILEACQEDQFAYEYKHGVESYGAFTYSLAQILRAEKKMTFHELVRKVRGRLKSLGYEQAPAILGPNKITKAQVPWQEGK